MAMYARLWVDILDDPKLMAAVDAGAKHLHLLPWLIAFAKRADADGRLEVAGVRAQPKVIARSIPNAKAAHVAAAIEELLRVGILGKDDDDVPFFVAWEYRNSGRATDTREAIAARVRRHRERRRAARSSDRSSPTDSTVATTGATVVETYVYYARDNDEVKIGFSRNPWARVNEMRTARPRMAIVAVERGTRDVEVKRHEQFARFRLSTGKGAEWYRWSPDIERHVRKLAGNERSVGNAVGNAVGNDSERREKREERRKERGERQAGTSGKDSLPAAARDFGRHFYSGAAPARKAEIKKQLLATLNGGARLRKGVIVRAQSVEQLERRCREVIAEGVKDPDKAIVVLLTKLHDVGNAIDSPTERAAAAAASEEQRTQLDVAHRLAQAVPWLEANPDVQAAIAAELETIYGPLPPLDQLDPIQRVMRQSLVLKAWTDAGEPTVEPAGSP